MEKNNRKKKYVGVISFILLLTLLIMILSFILNLIGINGEITSINNGLLESSLVTLNNIFSLEGLKFLIGNAVDNFKIFEPLVILIISIMCTGILESSGILNHIFSRFGKLKTGIITFFTLLVSILFVFFGENSYLFLFPLIGSIYKVMGRNPVIGLITVFLGVTLGYGSGIFANNDMYILGTLTEQAAALDVDPSYKFNMFSTIYIMILGAVLLIVFLSMFIENNISNKLSKTIKNEKEYNLSRKALIISGISFLILMFIIIMFLLPSSPFLDQNGVSYMAKLFGENSIFNNGLIYVMLLLFILIGTIYGKISKNFETDVEANIGISSNFQDLGYVFVIMFFSAQLISVLDYTNIGTILVTSLTDIISVMDFSGIFLIIAFMLIVIITSILIPNLIDKWVLMSPVIIPLFMRANITPEFCQYLYVFFNSIGRCITPLFVYILILIGFMNKYNIDETPITVTGTLKLMIPTILSTVGIMILFVFLWYISGLPVGIGGFPTL